MATWSDAAFVDAVRRSASAAQFSRFKRLYREPFYVLETVVTGPTDACAARLVLSGSTGSGYRMRIDRATGRVSCGCMDACTNCTRLHVACKHACFVVARVLRLDVEAVLSFLSTLRLRPRDVDAIALDGSGGDASPHPPEAGGSIDIDRLCAELDRGAAIGAIGSPARIPSPVDFETVKRPPEPGDDCPVCYCELLTGGNLRGCPDCGRGVHLECVRRWLAHAARPTCVFCRSTVWSKFPR